MFKLYLLFFSSRRRHTRLVSDWSSDVCFFFFKQKTAYEIITITWLTNTAISGARLYWESKLPYFSVKGVSIPVAVSAFPDEIDLCPRSWAERAYPKLIH